MVARTTAQDYTSLLVDNMYANRRAWIILKVTCHAHNNQIDVDGSR